MWSQLLLLLLLPAPSAAQAPIVAEGIGDLTGWQVPRELAVSMRRLRDELEACPTGPLKLEATLRAVLRVEVSGGEATTSLKSELPSELASCLRDVMATLSPIPDLDLDAEVVLVWTGRPPADVATQRKMEGQLGSLQEEFRSLSRGRRPIAREFNGQYGSVSFGELGALGEGFRHHAASRISRLLPELHAAWQASEARHRGGRFVVRLHLETPALAVDVVQDELDHEALRVALVGVLRTLRLPPLRDRPPLLTLPLLFTP